MKPPTVPEIEDWWEHMNPGSQRAIVRELRLTGPLQRWNARDWEKAMDYYVRVVEGNPRGYDRGRNIAMNKSASPRELQAELHQLMASLRAYGPEGRPDRYAVVAKLRNLADRVAGGGPDPWGRGWRSRGDRTLWDSPEDDISFTVGPVRSGGFGLTMLYGGEVYSWKGTFESQEEAFEAAARLYQKLTRTAEADRYLKMFRRLAAKKIPKGDPRRLDEDTFTAKPFHERGTEASESWEVSDDAGNQWVARKIRGKWEYESTGKGRRASGRTSNYSDPVKRLTTAVRDAHKALAVLKKSRVSEVDYERATTELSEAAQAFHSASRDLAYWARMIEHSADKLEDALEAFPAVMSPKRDEDAAVDRSDVDRAEDSVKAVEGFVRSLG